MDILTNLEAVRDLEFHHEYISDQIEKFAITPILCNNCNDLSRHFLHPAFYTNELYVKNSKWILNSDSKLTMDIFPYNELTISIYDVRNVSMSHPADRPRGKIHLCREASNIIKKEHFVRTAHISLLSALKRLQNKPFMCAELAHKLSEDVDQVVLVKLEDYLKLPEIKKLGITNETVHANIVPLAIHLVANLSSSSLPLRLVVAPNRQEITTRQSINSALHSSLPQLPKIQEVLLKFRLSLSLAMSDLCAFYKRNILDPAGSLMSAIYLQGNPSSKYPTLDPECNDPLLLWIFLLCEFRVRRFIIIKLHGKKLNWQFLSQTFPGGIA